MRFVSVFVILICQMAAGLADMVYHGSPTKFDFLEARPSTRYDSETGKVSWDGVAAFATPDFRIALFYTQDRPAGFSAGIDLISLHGEEVPLTYTLYGGTSLDEALMMLFGTSDQGIGYIYMLDEKFFHWEEGLGQEERISYDSLVPVSRIAVNRRQKIDEYVKRGEIILDWQPQMP